MVKQCNLQTDEGVDLQVAKLLSFSFSMESSGRHQILGFAEKLFLQSVGTPLAKRIRAAESRGRRK